LLNQIPKVLIDDRRMLAFVDSAFMGDAADIDRVRQEFVDVPPAEQAAAGRAARAIDANRNPQILGVEGLLKADDASRFEIAPEQGAHDRCMIIDDAQSAILDPIAQRNRAAHPHSLLLRQANRPRYFDWMATGADFSDDRQSGGAQSDPRPTELDNGVIKD